MPPAVRNLPRGTFKSTFVPPFFFLCLCARRHLFFQFKQNIRGTRKRLEKEAEQGLLTVAKIFLRNCFFTQGSKDLTSSSSVGSSNALMQTSAETHPALPNLLMESP